MPINDCINDIMNESGLSRTDAARVMDRLDDYATRLQEKQGLGRDEALNQAMRELSDQAEAAAAIQQRNQLMNLQKRVSRRNRIDQAAKDLGGDLAGAIRNQMVDINTPTRGGRLSAEGEATTWHDRYLSGLTNELERGGLFKVARSNKFQRQWGRELYELSMQGAGEGGNPGVTGNQHAMDIANSIDKYMLWAKGNLNKAGAWIGDYAGYITRTAHDGDKMRRAGFDGWAATIGPLLDEGRTFEGVDNRGNFLRGVYNALVTGVHLSDEGGVGFKDPAFTGPANLAKKLSESRVLHFKDADAWMDYQEKFGTGTMLEQVYGSLGRAAHSQALLNRWGTNPGAEFEQDIQWAKEKYRDTDTGAVDKLDQSQAGLKNIFNQLTGEANRPANRLAARIGSYVRLDESMAKLGMVAATHLSAGYTKAGELHYQGVPWMQAYGNFFTAPFRSFSSGEAARWADETLAGMEGTNRDILSGFSMNDSMPGTASRLANLFFKMSGLTWLLNKQKAGAEWAISRRLGMNIDREHGALDPQMQRSMLQYDISPQEWDILRQAPDHVQINDRQFLTPQAALRAPEEAFEQMLRDRGELTARSTPDFAERKVEAAREALAMKVHGWLHDAAERSVVTPGIEDRALILGSSQPGTLGGEFWRFVSQFKMWPIAAIRQQLGRELYGTPGDAMGKVGGVMNLMVGSLVTGYAVMTLKALLKGQEPRDITNPKIMGSVAMAAMMQGGGLGIAGDYLFGEYNRFGQSPTESFLGPVLGQTATTVIDLWNRIKGRATDAHPKDIGPEATKLLTDNLPFVNLFYVRQAFNYLFLHSLQETLNPGYLQRSERSLKNKTGSTYYLSPADNHLHTFGR